MSVNSEIDSNDRYIEATLKKFNLVDIRCRYAELIEKAIEKNLGYKEFLVSLLIAEEEGKKHRRTQRNIKAACFEGIKTIEEYDFGFHRYQNMQKIKELSTLQFLIKNENIIFIGKTGVGKSHIATGIGMKACEAGKKVLFVNAMELIGNLSKAASEGNLKESLMRLSRMDLIIIDELGYMKMDREKESIFFQLVRSRYEKKSIIITTNLELREWDDLFTSQLAATAILDRLIHHSHIVRMGVGENDDSYRIKGNRKEEKS